MTQEGLAAIKFVKAKACNRPKYHYADENGNPKCGTSGRGGSDIAWVPAVPYNDNKICRFCKFGHGEMKCR